MFKGYLNNCVCDLGNGQVFSWTGLSITTSFFFWLCLVACEILVPQPGFELVVPEVEANHWTAREIPTTS